MEIFGTASQWAAPQGTYLWPSQPLLLPLADAAVPNLRRGTGGKRRLQESLNQACSLWN